MVFKVVWTGPARAELREIKNYIAADNPAAAKRVIQEIEARVDRLETMPFGFPEYEPSRDENTRHMVVGHYRIFYRVYPDKQRIRILTVWHSSRREPRLPLD